VWQFLNSAFASQSQARIMQLRISLHSLKKGSDSMTTYLLKAKSIANELALASKPVSEDDMVLYILGGLSSKYAAFAISITSRAAPISVADLHGLLLNEETRQISATDLANATANLALTQRPSNNRNQNQNRGRGRGFNGRRGRGCHSSQFSQHEPRSGYQHQRTYGNSPHRG
ncbi:UBN2 domain-containing protein, partial [Cephalotus follicularis]